MLKKLILLGLLILMGLAGCSTTTQTVTSTVTSTTTTTSPVVTVVTTTVSSTAASAATSTATVTETTTVAIPVTVTAQEPEPVNETTEAPTTFEPVVFTGHGETTTPPFTVTTDEWIVEWSYTTSEPEYALFGFYIYPRGETVMFIMSVTFPDETSGMKYSYYGPGDYYLDVIASSLDSWSITIKPAP
jgi:hypothetical protein